MYIENCFSKNAFILNVCHYSIVCHYYLLILNSINNLNIDFMKKIIILSFWVIMFFGATSCVKDWQCECTDGTSTNVVETYPNTKLLDAKKVCDGRQSDLKTLNSNISCKIK